MIINNFSSWWALNLPHYKDKPLTEDIAKEIFEMGNEIIRDALRDKLENIREAVGDAVDDCFVRIDSDL